MTSPVYTPLDLASCLASRLCHDLISPIGAIVNGFELLEDKATDSETRAFALDMVAKSAKTASAQLQFARLAFGVMGHSPDVTVGPHELQKIAIAALENPKLRFSWTALPPHPLTKYEAKVFLNLLVLATRTLPRGGEITIHFSHSDHDPILMTLIMNGSSARWPLALKTLGYGYPISTDEILSVHSVALFYTHLSAQEEHLSIKIQDKDETCVSIEVIRQSRSHL